MRKPLLSLAALALVVGACASSASQSYAPSGNNPPDPGHHQPTRGAGTAGATPYGGVTYEDPGANPFVDPDEDRVSTFALDVDTASYTIAQRYIDDGNRPDPASVRVEEWVNAFDQGYRAPDGRRLRDHRRRRADAVHRRRRGPGPDRPAGARRPRSGPRGRLADLRHRHVRLDGARRPARARQGRAADPRRRARPRRPVAVVDVRRRRPRRPATDLVARQRPDPRGDRRAPPGGSTNLEAGLRLGYEQAREALTENGIDRVVLASDGVANVGLTGCRRDPRADPRGRRGRHRARQRRRRDGQLQRRAARAARRPGRRVLRLRQRARRGPAALSRRADLDAPDRRPRRARPGRVRPGPRGRGLSARRVREPRHRRPRLHRSGRRRRARSGPATRSPRCMPSGSGRMSASGDRLATVRAALDRSGRTGGPRARRRTCAASDLARSFALGRPVLPLRRDRRGDRRGPPRQPVRPSASTSTDILRVADEEAGRPARRRTRSTTSSTSSTPPRGSIG